MLRSLSDRKAYILIIFLGFIVFFNALFNNFVWDDITYILTNTDTHSFNLFHLFGPNMFNASGYYRPIPAVYFTILYLLSGFNAFYYHLIQIALHIFNVCLLYYFLKSFIKKNIALFLSLVFLVHPINVESVVYIGASQSELFFFFGITALIISIGKVIDRKKLLSIFILLLLALLTKETAFLFLPLILLFQFLFKKKDLLPILIVEVAATLTYLFFRFAAGGVFLFRITFVPIGRLSLIQRTVSMPQIAYYYLKTAFFPATLAIDQLWTVKNVIFSSFYLPLFLVFVFFAVLLFFAYSLYRNKSKDAKIYAFFFAWFLMGLVMILQIYPLDMTVADRWFYFPFAGLLGVFGVMLGRINFKNNSVYKRVSVLICVIILLALSVRTVIRNRNWYTGLTLYAHDLPLADNFDNENNYGAFLGFEGEHKLALVHFKKSIEMYAHENNLENVGEAYLNLNQKNLALEYFYKALGARSFVGYPHLHEEDTYGQIVKLQYQNGNMNEVKRISSEGVKDYPGSSNLWLFLSLSDYNLKDFTDALAAAGKAYSLNPDSLTYYVFNQISNKQEIKLQ